MQITRKYARMSITLGILTLIALCFSCLALTDIANKESDLALEWAVLRVTSLIILMFVALTVMTLRRVLQSKL